MKVKITKLARNPMQSGLGKDKLWLLSVPAKQDERYINDVTGWTSCNNTQTQIKLKFSSKEDAIKYADENNFEYEICEAKNSSIKEKSYDSNFLKPILN